MRAREFAVPADVSQVAFVRKVARDVATQWGVPEDRAGDAALVVSELTTNAILHASSTVRIGLHRVEDILRVEVHDDLATRPAPRPAGVEAPGGRGLHLVEAVANRWGVRRSDDGKCVWAELICHEEPGHTEDSLTG